MSFCSQCLLVNVQSYRKGHTSPMDLNIGHFWRCLLPLCQNECSYKTIHMKGWCSSSREVSYEWLATLWENNKTNNRNNGPGPTTISSCYNDKTKAAFDSWYENVFHPARSLGLKQRHGGTCKWPVGLGFLEVCSFTLTLRFLLFQSIFLSHFILLLIILHW